MSSKNPRLKNLQVIDQTITRFAANSFAPAHLKLVRSPTRSLLPSQLNASSARTYVAFPKSSIRPAVLRIYVARVPAAPFHHYRIAGDTPAATDLTFVVADETAVRGKSEVRMNPSGFRRFRALFVHEWNVVGREDCISAASRIARPLPRGFTGHVAQPSRSIRCDSIRVSRAPNPFRRRMEHDRA
jgi:hypothetical protein